MSWYDGPVADLRSGLARLLSIDLWPPWDAARTVVDLASDALRVATGPPLPDPTAVEDAAQEWRRAGAAVETAGEELATVSRTVHPDVWAGEAGDAFRGSVALLTARVGTVPPAAAEVTAALSALGAGMAAARERHERGRSRIRRCLPFEWSDANPFQLRDRLVTLVEDAVAGTSDLVGAYEDADAAVAAARRRIAAAMDRIDLPRHLPEGGAPSVIDLVNAWDDRNGPLDAAVLGRYDPAWEHLTPAERRAVRESLAEARNAQETAWIIAGVAGGLGGATLRRYLDRLQALSRAELHTLDSRNVRAGDRRGAERPPLRQPDSTTCGSSSLVVSHMLHDPAYDMWMLTGYDPGTGDLDPRSVADRFESEVLAMHDRTNGLRDAVGGWQVPWPEALGTQPWAVANQMASGSGVPGMDYDVRLVDPRDPGSSYDAMVAATGDGGPVPFFVGDALSPRHVMLATATDDGSLVVYDPGSGLDVGVTREQWTGSAMPGTWREPWAVVVPSS